MISTNFFLRCLNTFYVERIFSSKALFEKKISKNVVTFNVQKKHVFENTYPS